MLRETCEFYPRNDFLVSFVREKFLGLISRKVYWHNMRECWAFIRENFLDYNISRNIRFSHKMAHTTAEIFEQLARNVDL